MEVNLTDSNAFDKGGRRQENRRFTTPRKDSSMTTLLKTDLGTTPLIGRGKVRDLYAVGDALLLVATDRISAFDHVLGTGIPGKGKILTQISLFWFELCSGHCAEPSDCHESCRLSGGVAHVCGPA